MATCGSKGSPINLCQMMACVGQSPGSVNKWEVVRCGRWKGGKLRKETQISVEMICPVYI